MAAPVTYRVDGEQYIAVLAGVGGSTGGHATFFDYENDGRVLAWKLGGKAPMPPVEKRPTPLIDPPPVEATRATLDLGRSLYAKHCMRCHGLGTKASGLYPDLRHTSRETHARWNDIVLGGIRAGGGMASFADVLDPDGARAIQAYVIERATHEPGALERLVGWMAEGPLCVPPSWGAD